MMDYKEIMEMLHKKKELDWSKVNEIDCQAYGILKETNTRAYQSLMQQLEHLAYSIDKKCAEEIVHNMRPKGEMWSLEQVEKYVAQKGIHGDCIEWYLVMNMCYNDYYGTAKMYGLQNEVDFYFNLAKDFIEDPDAEPHKVARYFCK